MNGWTIHTELRQVDLHLQALVLDPEVNFSVGISLDGSSPGNMGSSTFFTDWQNSSTASPFNFCSIF